MTDRDRWHNEIQKYIDGTLGAEEVAALSAALESSLDLRRLYLELAVIDGAIDSLMVEQAMPERRLLSELAGLTLPDSSDSARPPLVTPQPKSAAGSLRHFIAVISRAVSGRRRAYPAAFAVALLLFVAGSLHIWSNSGRPKVADHSMQAADADRTPVPVIARRPLAPLAKDAGLHRIAPPKAFDFPQGQVAVVTGEYNATWSSATGTVKLGSGLAVGRELRLDSGLIELTFKLGARVIVEGPAHFRATSIDGIEMLDGNVSVRCDTEAARGFVVKSAVAKVTDLGTEFGAAVDADRQTDLHVFQGMVEVLRNSVENMEPFRMTAGQRVVLRRAGKMQIPSSGADDQRFTRSLETVDAAFRRWQRWSLKIRQSPDLVGYYTFDQTGHAEEEKGRREKGRALSERMNLSSPTSRKQDEGRGAGSHSDNTSPADLAAIHSQPWIQGEVWSASAGEGKNSIPSVAARGTASPGVVYGASWTEGRWPSKPALQFSGSADCVHLRVPGKFPALTLSAWVNLEGLHNEFNGLLLSDGWRDPGQCHWQITRSGRLDFGVHLQYLVDSVYRSPALPEADDFGRWVHLAVTYDTAARQICFYVDGRQVNTAPIADEAPLVLGDCEIGNWNYIGSDGFPIRNFQGRIDELMIFRRALSPAEVRNMLEEGKP